MKHLSNSLKMICLIALAAFAASCTSPEGKENMLVAAGFRAKAATTPQQLAHLKSLPAGKVTMVQRNGKVFYVFPDAANRTIYIGQQQAYQNYQQLRLQKQMSNENLEAAQLSAAQPEVWDVWGPEYWYPVQEAVVVVPR